MSFTPISREAVQSFDKKLDPLLERMVKRSGGRLDIEGLYASLAAGSYWLAEVDNWRAAMILNPINWRTGLNELEIVGFAGDGLAEWEETVFSAEKLARELHFNKLSIPHGRKGWARLCKAHGWRESGVILEKDLHDG